ncbi:hypothetical protein BGZ65_003402, partial [Modicella reniformis]
EEQLALYAQEGTQGRIPSSYLKVLALLSGELKVNIAPKGEPIQTVADGLDWRRTFGLYLWHSITPGANLKEAVEQYTVSMSMSKTIARPHPWYHQDIQDQDPKYYDFLFQLIALSTMPSKNLEDTLHPLGMTPACIDYRQSWLFYMVLTQSLHVGRFRSETSHTKICQDFMFQLETLGLWEWAVFIALHLESAETREMVVRQLMSFLHRTLQIPMAWIWIARATRAKYQGDVTWEVFSLLKGGEHQKGHGLVLSQLAPACILRGQLPILDHILGMIDQSKVSGWETGGSIYQKYVKCCTDFEVSIGRLKLKGKVSYSSDLVPEQDIHNLQIDVQQLMTKLPLLMAQRIEANPELQVCVAEMASKCTNVLRALKDLTIQESATLTDLPLTEEQRMSTVQKISSDYFDEILTVAETSVC